MTIPRRIRFLRNAETFCAVAMPAVIGNQWQQSPDPVAWTIRSAALALVGYLLLQGAGYWQLKLQGVMRRQPLPTFFQPLYRFFQYSNVALIAAVAALIGTHDTATTSDLLWACGLLTFVLAEHINYYHYQLMYDTSAAFAYLRRNRRLRKAVLGLDLKR